VVNIDKRQRHKEGHRSRVEAARIAEAQRRRRRRLVMAGILLATVVAVFVAVTVTSDDDGDETATTTTPSTAPTTSTPEVTTPAPGESVDGETPCPPADGSAARTTAFAEVPPTCIDDTKTYTATVATSEGEITIDLDTEQSPIAVNNFVVLARYHYFDGLPFHRVVPGFVNQTGSSGVPDVGSGGPGYDLPDEPPSREYAAGDVAMAQGGGSTSGSQFFFTIDPASLQGGTYPIIGTVSGGQEVVQAINALGAGDGPPTESVTIESVTITEA
jgi:cyclophilin family peptidyl-prolyl cis-trans isomerase